MPSVLESDREDRRKLILATSIALVLGWLLRGLVQFSTDLPPGINGAYYQLQTRNILQTGALGVSDFPLLFYIDAFFAYLPNRFFGQDGILFTTRVLDVLLPVLIALPACRFAHDFATASKNRKSQIFACLVTGLFAALNGSLLRMLGDFQKNAFGLVLSLSFLYFLFRAFQGQAKSNRLLALLFLALACLTHIGVAGVTLMMAGVFILFILLFSRRKKAVLLLLLGALLVAGVSFALVSLFDPARVERLLGSTLDPAALFRGAAIQRWFAFRAAKDQRGFRLSDAPNLIALSIAAFGAFFTLFGRKQLSPPNKALLWACVLTTLLLALPIYNPTYGQRFTYMAFLPAIPLLAFINSRGKTGGVLAVALLLLELLFSTGYQLANPQQTIKLDAYKELGTFQEQIEPESTLIYARHGLEWWVAWTMESNVVNNMLYFVENWDEYDHFYLVDEIDPSGFTQSGGVAGAKAAPDEPEDQRPGSPQFIFPTENDDGKTVYSLTQEDVRSVATGRYFELLRVLNVPAEGEPQKPATGLRVIPRAEWGAREMNLDAANENGLFDPQTNPQGVMVYQGELSEALDTIVIHHSALPSEVGVRGIQDLHMDKRGFADIGYHFVIHPDGQVFEGRPLNIRGVHTRDHNSGAIGIVLTGNFEVDHPTPRQVESLFALVGELSRQFGIAYLAGHNDLNPDLTACPGVHLSALLPDLAHQNNLQLIE